MKGKQRAQTREKFKRLSGQRGRMANRENIQGEPDKRKCCDWTYESGIEKGKEMVGKCDVWRKTERVVCGEENLYCSI